MEDLIQDLKSLTPEQLEQVARMVHEFSSSGEQPSQWQTRREMPQSIIDDAVFHGWPPELFMTLIGSLPQMERAPQPNHEIREGI